ncbi:MAG TPA: T9SS type A sorting domain-containing protein [Ignavibacteriales bacterium]|nr:T9SS type A sorting domain-containing protein [Ignavibacteriales bacterium]
MKNFFTIVFALAFIASVYPQTWNRQSGPLHDIQIVQFDNEETMYGYYNSYMYRSKDLGEHWEIIKKFPYTQSSYNDPAPGVINGLFLMGNGELAIHYKDSLYISGDRGLTFNDTSYFPSPYTAVNYFRITHDNMIFNPEAYSTDYGHSFTNYAADDTLYKNLRYIDNDGNFYSYGSTSGKGYKWRIDSDIITESVIPSYIDSLGHIILYGVFGRTFYTRYYLGTKFQEYISVNGDTAANAALNARPVFDDIFYTMNGLYRAKLDSIPDYYTDSTGIKYPKYISSWTLLANVFKSPNSMSYIFKGPEKGTLLAKGEVRTGFYSYYYFFKSYDNGASWDTIITRCEDQKFNTEALRPQGFYFAGTNGYGLWEGGYDSYSMTKLFSNLDIKKYVRSSGGMYYIADMQDGGLTLYNTDGFHTSTDMSTQLGVHPRLLSAAGTVVAFADDSNSVYASVNSGAFKKVLDNAGLPDPAKSRITGLFADNNKIYAAISNPDSTCGIAVINSDGTVSKEYKPDGAQGFTCFAKDKEGAVYAGGDGKSIYKLAADDSLWRALPFEIISVQDLTADSAGVIYAGVIKNSGEYIYSAVYYTADGGESWSLFASPLDSAAGGTDYSALSKINDMDANDKYVAAVTDWNVFASLRANYIGAKDEKPQVAESYTLDQNYPNPFNPGTVISFNLPKASKIKLSIYNTLGQLVSVLANGDFAAGSHKIEFNGKTLSSGIYFYSLEAGNFRSIRKMVLMK